MEEQIPQIVGGDANDEDGKNEAKEGEEFNTNLGDFTIQKGPNALRCTNFFSECHHFWSFLPCTNTFMDDYDGNYNCNGLKYSPFEIFDNF